MKPFLVSLASLETEVGYDDRDLHATRWSGDIAAAKTIPSSSLLPNYATLPEVDPGHYTDRSELTRGGMGRIIVARDRRMHRKVALKELRTDSPELRARFEREALLTGRLEHPSIVSIHEAGHWPSGEPFFAMKLVPGRSLDVVIAAAATFEQRLALVPHALAVADALAYAHSMRIIHRDLKPQNVLVGNFGETVVIDWGLAKCLDDSVPELAEIATLVSSEGTDATEHGDVLGTPAYMPPEQARGEPVDERADVYAIGALLCHLLSGKPPYVGNSSAAVLDAVLHAPPESLASREPRVPSDLLAIVERAMSRDAAARYPTAREIAEDLRRFQAGKLVGAHRYTPGQLLRRWIGKYRLALSVAAIAFVALGVLGALSFQRIVDKEADAQSARKLAEDRGALATRRGAAAEELMSFMLGDLRNRLEPLGKLELLDTVAVKVREFYQGESFATNPVLQAQARRYVGDVLQTKGDAPGALVEYRAGLALLETQLVKTPGERSVRAETYELHFRTAEVLSKQRDDVGAQAEVQKAMTLIDGLLRESATDALRRSQAVGHMHLALYAAQRGEHEVALSELDVARTLFEGLLNSGKATERDLMVIHDRVSDIRGDRGDASGSLAERRAAVALAQQYVDKAPGDRERRRDLAIMQRSLADQIAGTGALRDALALYQTSKATAEQLTAYDPLNTNWQFDLIETRVRIGRILNALGQQADAETALRAAITQSQRLVDLDASNARWQRQLAEVHHEVADLLSARNDRVGAIRELRTALTVLEAIAKRAPGVDSAQLDLAVAQLKLADAVVEGREVEPALVSYRAALAIVEPRAARDAGNVSNQSLLSVIHGRIGASLVTAGDLDGAVPEFRASLAIDEKLAALAPTDVETAADLVESHVTLAELHTARKDAAAARAEYVTAFALAEKLVIRMPGDAVLARRLTQLRKLATP